MKTHTKWKIGKFSRTFLSIILQSACKYLKSIRFHKDSLREKCPNTEVFLVRILPHSDQKNLRIWTFFTQYYTRVFYRLQPPDQNSSNFLHLCINSIAIYLRPWAEATIQRCSLKSCSQTQRCSVEQLLCFFPAKFTRNYLFQKLF